MKSIPIDKLMNCVKIKHYAGVAHLVERELPKLEVAGSRPVARF